MLPEEEEEEEEEKGQALRRPRSQTSPTVVRVEDRYRSERREEGKYMRKGKATSLRRWSK